MADEENAVQEEEVKENIDVQEVRIWDKDEDVPLVFGKYDIREVVVEDPSLRRYINLDPRYVFMTSGRHANKRFAKAKVNIIERLINNMMRTEDYTGKKMKAYKVVMLAFDEIHRRTKQNPIQVLVKALEHAAPMEEITRLKFGGISVAKAVDTSASRRLDIALGNICKGALKSSYKSSKPIYVCLANEIIKASEGSLDSFAVSKKDEIERVAASAR